MKPLPTRILAAVLSSALALGVVAVVWSLQGGDKHIGLVNNTVLAQELLESRQESRLSSRSDVIVDGAPSLAERSSLTESEASSIFAIPTHTFMHDWQTYYRYKPDLELERLWDEHPLGRWVLETNSIGLREDKTTDLAAQDRYVLVAGDSHTDGMCSNSESFPQLVEANLRSASPDKSIEVLNTGTSGYNFFNYLGALDKFGEVTPDTFIIGIYGGNDYLGSVMPQHFFTGTAPQPRFDEYWKKLNKARNVSSSAVGMALNQAYYFQHYPDEIEVALSAALGIVREIQAICREKNTKLIWVYIPPLYDVDEDRAAEMDRARDVIGLTDYDMSVADRLTDSVLELARKDGNSVVDLREEFVGREGPFYWADGHINVTSHKLIADLLMPHLK